MQAEAKAKNDAELAKVAKYVEDRRDAAQAAQIAEDNAYLTEYKKRVNAVIKEVKANKDPLGVPPLPPLPEPTEYEIIKNSPELTDSATTMRKAMGGLDAG